MKKINILLLLVILGFSSCSKFVDGLEESPNSPSEATPGLLLTTIQVSTFATYGGQLARNANVLTQTLEGVQFQAQDLANYIILEGDNVNEWDNLYTNALGDSYELIKLTEGVSPHYSGVGKILTALNLSVVTDFWGDAPFSQAFKGQEGAENFNPAYDSQEQLYQSIQSYLDAGIADLGNAESKESPGKDDLIYGGDLTKWKNAAKMLKARYALRLTAVNASAANTALDYVTTAINDGFSSDSSDMNAYFYDTPVSLNQWFAYNRDRAGYIKMGKNLVDIMNNSADPRLPFYAKPDEQGGYSGSVPGSGDGSTSDMGPYFASTSSDSPIATYVEAKFIEAEAAFRTGNTDRAASAYNAAVAKHVLKVTGAAAPQSFVDAFISETAGSITLEKIMTQKYVSMFTQMEVYHDWRRTGFPNLSPNPTGNVAGIPLRLPTVQSERQYNTNAPQNTNILEPVWWDK